MSIVDTLILTFYFLQILVLVKIKKKVFQLKRYDHLAKRINLNKFIVCIYIYIYMKENKKKK